MASLYRKKGSPFWWLKYSDPDHPKADKQGRVRQSTEFRIGVGDGTRKARELQAGMTLKERTTNGTLKGDVWVEWVVPFIQFRYRHSPLSMQRYTIAWKTLSLFMEEKEIKRPSRLTRAHCLEYTDWRAKADSKKGKYAAGQNTAVVELKFLALVMKEAVIRGFAPANVARELGIRRTPRRLYPEYTDAELAKIEEAIEKEPADKKVFLRQSYLLARYHGVRLIETHVNPMRDVRIYTETGADGQSVIRGTIRFFQKGSKERIKPLHPALIENFRELQKVKAAENYPMPKAFAKQWFLFLHRAGIKAESPNACFHSLRVTVQNKMRRGGIGKELRKAYMSHDSGDVNESYDRFTLQELSLCHHPLTSVGMVKSG